MTARRGSFAGLVALAVLSAATAGALQSLPDQASFGLAATGSRCLSSVLNSICMHLARERGLGPSHTMTTMSRGMYMHASHVSDAERRACVRQLHRRLLHRLPALLPHPHHRRHPLLISTLRRPSKARRLGSRAPPLPLFTPPPPATVLVPPPPFGDPSLSPSYPPLTLPPPPPMVQPSLNHPPPPRAVPTARPTLRPQPRPHAVPHPTAACRPTCQASSETCQQTEAACAAEEEEAHKTDGGGSAGTFVSCLHLACTPSQKMCSRPNSTQPVKLPLS